MDTHDLTKFIRNKIESNKFIPGMYYIASEYNVYGSFNGDCSKRGLIDFVVKYRSYKYLIEVSLGTDVLHAIKILGYRAAYQIDNSLEKKKMQPIKPAILLYQKDFHPNVRNIYSMLGIHYIIVDLNGEIIKHNLMYGYKYNIV